MEHKNQENKFCDGNCPCQSGIYKYPGMSGDDAIKEKHTKDLLEDFSEKYIRGLGLIVYGEPEERTEGFYLLGVSTGILANLMISYGINKSINDFNMHKYI
jgi:hypothetical protein